MERLRREAAGLGASGVIGIDLDDLAAFRGGGGDYQVVLHLLGTAVRRDPAATRAGGVIGVGGGGRVGVGVGGGVTLRTGRVAG
jgi:hypothetical protein